MIVGGRSPVYEGRVRQDKGPLTEAIPLSAHLFLRRPDSVPEIVSTTY